MEGMPRRILGYRASALCAPFAFMRQAAERVAKLALLDTESRRDTADLEREHTRAERLMSELLNATADAMTPNANDLSQRRTAARMPER